MCMKVSTCIAIIACTLFSYSVFAQTNYYYKGSGTITTLSSWGANTDGTGGNPTSFTDPSQIFTIQNIAAITLNANWDVSGAASKVIIGDGTNACNFSTSTFSITGTVDVSATGTFTVQANTGFTLGSCAIGSTVNYVSTANQNIAGGVYHHLIIGGTGTRTKTALGNITVNGNFTHATTTNTLAMGTFEIQGIAGTISGAGIISTTNTGSTPLPAGLNWSQAISYTAVGSQTVVGGTYINLTISGGGNNVKTAAANMVVNGTLTVAASTFFDLTTFTLTAPLLTHAVSGSMRTANTTGAPIPAGRNWGAGTVLYNSTSPQTVVDGSYFSLTLTGGDRTISTADTLIIRGTFTTGSGAITTTGTTIGLTGTTQAITLTAAQPLSLNNLYITSGTKTFSNNAIDITLQGDLNIEATRTLALGTNRLFFGGTQTLSGTGILSTTCILTNPLPSNITWPYTVTYASAVNHELPTGVYSTLIVSGNGIATATGDVTVTNILNNGTGNTFNLSTFRLLGSITGGIVGTGILATNYVGGSDAFPSGKQWSGTVSYTAAAAQDIVPAVSYTSLTIAGGGSNIKTATSTLTVNATLSISASTILDLGTQNLAGTLATITVTGTLRTANTTATPIPVGKTYAGTIEYNSASSQTVVNAAYTNLNISGGDRILSTSDSIKVSTTFTSTSGAITATGSIFVLSGATTQTITLGSTGAFNDFILYGTIKTIASGDLTINGKLDIPTGKTLTMGLNQLLGTLNDISGAGTITTTCISATPVPSGKTWTQTVNYSGVAQTIASGTYQNLTGSGSGTKTAGGNIEVIGTLNTGALVFDMSTFALTGITTATASTGTLNTACTMATPIPGGKTWNFATVNYNAASNQNVVSGQYVALNLTGGDRTLSPTDTIKISGTFTTGTGTFAHTGSTVALNGATTQSIVGGGNTFNNFAILTGTTKTVSVNGINVDGELNIPSGKTLAMTTFDLGGAVASTSGNGAIITTSVSSTPLSSGKTWTQKVTYSGVAQTIVGGTYQSLVLAGTLLKSASGNIQVIDTLNTGTLTFEMSTFALSGITTLLTSTGILNTACTAATPLPVGKTWTYATVNYNSASNQNVVSGQYIILNLTGGNRTLSPTDTIKVSSTLTMGTGTSYTNTGSTVALTGTTQTINGGNNNFNNLAFTAGTVKTVAVNGINVDGQLSIPSGMTLAMGLFNLGGAVASTNGTGTITTSSIGATPLAAGKTWSQTVNYGGVAQTIVGGTYGNLTLSGSGLKTASGDIEVTSTLITNALTVEMSTFALSGVATLGVATGILNTACTSATPLPTGKIWTYATLNYNSAGHQNVVSGQYAILNLSGGDRTLWPTDTIKVSGTFTTGTGTYTSTGSSVALIGATTQSIVAGGNTFNNLAITAGTIKTVSVNGINVNGELYIAQGATLTMATFNLGGAIASTNGNGNITTASVSSTPLSAGKTWTQKVTYNGVAQTIVGGTYQSLVLGGTLLKTASGNIQVVDTLNTGALTFNMSTFELSGVTTLATSTGILNTACESATPLPAGVNWTYTTVNYNSANEQTVIDGQYIALNLTGGDRILSSADSIKVSGTLTLNAGVLTNTNSTVALNGATTQSLIGGNAFNNLAITTGTIKTVTIGGINVEGELLIATGTSLVMGTFQLGGAVPSISGDGTLSTSNVGATPIPFGKAWTQTVHYAASSQTVVGGSYATLRLTGSSTVKTANDDITVVNDLIFGSTNATLAMGVNQLSGIAGTSSGGGTITTGNTSATPIPAGINWSQALTYNSTSAQTVVDGFYMALNIAGGNRTISTLAPINVSGTFTANTSAATYTTAGTIFNFNGTAASQALTLKSGFTFENVQFTGANIKVPSIAFVVTDSIQIASGVTVNMATFLLTGSFVTSGSGVLRTQNTTTAPIPVGKEWSFRILLDANGNQSIPAGTYNGGMYLAATTGTRLRTLQSDVTIADTLTITDALTSLVLNGRTLTLTGMINPAEVGTITGGLTSNIVVDNSTEDAGTLNMTQTDLVTRSLNDLTISRNTGADAIILGNELRLTNILTLTDGTLASNGNLVFVSSDTSTSAQVDAVTGTGNVSGKVVVERFLDGDTTSAKVRWRFLASSVTTDDFISNNWQQQMFITGVGTGGTLCPSLTPNSNGFDKTVTNAASFYTYNAGIDNWASVANTNSTNLQTGIGYRIFYRGTRSQGCDAMLGAVVNSPKDTTLVATGNLAIGTQVLTGGSAVNRYALVGNPYQATIDWESPAITMNNLSSTISTFTPNSTLGSYAYYTRGVGGTNGMTQYMAPGMSFWIQTVAAAPSSVTIQESAKVVSQGGDGFFKNGSVDENVLRIKLVNNDNGGVLDEAIIAERANSSWNYNAVEEAMKLEFVTNSLQLTIPNAISKYAICVVPGFDSVNNNRINIQAKTTVGKNYKLNFSGMFNFNTNYNFVLVDTYTNTNQNLNTTPGYSFATLDAASTSITRFYIIITPNSQPLPVKLISFTAKANKAKTVDVTWRSATEVNALAYQVERSTDAKQFEIIGSVKAVGNSSSVLNYAFNDNAPVANTTNYYRLKLVDADKKFSYSAIQVVNLDNVNSQISAGDIKVYPVPTTDLLTIEVNPQIVLVNVKIRVIDLMGKEYSLPTVNTNNEWQINTQSLSGGLYIVQIENNGVVTNYKITKQ
jgi:hypothetical protein